MVLLVVIYCYECQDQGNCQSLIKHPRMFIFSLVRGSKISSSVQLITLSFWKIPPPLCGCRNPYPDFTLTWLKLPELMFCVFYPFSLRSFQCLPASYKPDQITRSVLPFSSPSLPSKFIMWTLSKENIDVPDVLVSNQTSCVSSFLLL